jgi:hypothetical protein
LPSASTAENRFNFSLVPSPPAGFENTSLLFGFPQLADNLPQAGGSAKSFQQANYRA